MSARRKKAPRRGALRRPSTQALLNELIAALREFVSLRENPPAAPSAPLVMPKRGRGERAAVPLQLPPPWVKVSESALAGSRARRAAERQGLVPVAFQLPEVPPGVLPKGATPKSVAMAMDDAGDGGMVVQANAWAAQQVYAGAFFNGVTFMGYTYLAELAQRPEYRRVTEVLATEATRKWIKLKSSSDDEGKGPKIAQLDAELVRLRLRDVFRKMSELDGFFGRAHLYVDTGSTDDRKELVTPIGDGRDGATVAKFKGRQGFLKTLRPVEPVWCYPARYEASDPLKADWYNPQTWFVMGKEVHRTRLLTFVAREVPDLLKPSYAFGGLSLTQMAKPYVDNWLRTRQAVANIVWSFNVRGFKTNMAAMMGADGSALFDRAAFFANIQSNQDIMLLDKDSEEFFQFTCSLATLDALQAQAQEQMCSVTGTPVVKLLGIQPAGLNASSEGELTAWEDWTAAYQEKFFDAHLTTCVDLAMMNLWGEVDPDITFDYEPIREMTEKELAEKRLQEAQTDQVYVEIGAVGPEDVRRRLANDPESQYDGLDVFDAPEDAGIDPEDPDLNPDLGSAAGQIAAATPTPREERLDRGRDGGEGRREETPPGNERRAATPDESDGRRSARAARTRDRGDR